MERFKSILSTIALPLFALAALVMFYGTWTLFDLPPQAEVIATAKMYFDQYGLIVVFVCALLEAMLFAGWYFPGSLVVTLAVVIAGKNVGQVVEITVVTTVAFIIAHSFNYLLGKYGWYKLFSVLGFQEPIDNAQKQLVKYGPRAVLFTYFHPNLGALTATAAGILHMPFVSFTLYSALAATLWDVFWATVAFFIGQSALAIIGPKFVLPFIAVWIIATLLYKYWKSTRPAEVTIQPSQQ